MKKIVVWVLIGLVMMFAGCDVEQSSSQPTESIMVKATRNGSDYAGENYISIAKELYDAGFFLLEYESIDDLMIDEADHVGAVVAVLINGEETFVQGQEFDQESVVIIRYHDYRECEVKINVDFASNFLFNKYDVEFLVDDDYEETFSHGEDAEINLELDVGTHTVEFVKEDSSSVKGTVTITVSGNMEIDYQISCHSDEIIVKTMTEKVLECEEANHVWQEASCTNPKVCSVCGKTDGMAKGHVWTDATCIAAKTCSLCMSIEGEPLAHAVDEWTISQKETCGADGVKTGLCKTCNQAIQQVIPQSGEHTYGNWQESLTPTCTIEGERKRICSTCQHEEIEKIEMLSHDYVETVLTEATHYEPGAKGNTCAVCGAEGETTDYYLFDETSLWKIFDAYRANEIAADEKYMYMYVSFSAKVSSIEQGGILSKGTILFDVNNGSLFSDEVECTIKTQEQLDYVKTLRVGNTVTVKGKIKMMLFDRDLGSNLYIDIVEIK